jgi:DNA-binding CsgD family transcriptional regulator
MENSLVTKKTTPLTKREKEVLVVYAKGKSHLETAKELNISLFTFRTHWRNIKNKSSIKNMVDVINYVNNNNNNP